MIGGRESKLLDLSVSQFLSLCFCLCSRSLSLFFPSFSPLIPPPCLHTNHCHQLFFFGRWRLCEWRWHRLQEYLWWNVWRWILCSETLWVRLGQHGKQRCVFVCVYDMCLCQSLCHNLHALVCSYARCQCFYSRYIIIISLFDTCDWLEAGWRGKWHYYIAFDTCDCLDTRHIEEEIDSIVWHLTLLTG